MNTLTKSSLIEMNSNKSMGFNWIRNIDSISDTEQAIIYPTWDAGLDGRLYVAFPADHVLTEEDIKKYNIWL